MTGFNLLGLFFSFMNLIFVSIDRPDRNDPQYIKKGQAVYQHNRVIGMTNGFVYDTCDDYNCAMKPLELAQIIVERIQSYRWRCSSSDTTIYSELCPERAPVSVSASTTPPLGETYIYPKAGQITVTTCCSTENQYLRSTANVLIHYGK